MKIILLGATGFIGSAVLEQLLQHPSVTSIIVLSRRALPASAPSDPKLQTLLVSDFSSYSPDVLSACAGAGAAIWAIGTAPSWNLENARKVDIDSVLAFADAFKPADSGSSKFRLVHLSGYLSAKDQDSTLWFLPSFRRLRGEAENRIAALGKEREGLETIITRPAMVLSASGGGLFNAIRGLFQNVRVDELAAALVHIAVEGSKDQFVENEELKARGKELVKQ